MSNTVIKVENLSKQYRLGQVGTGTISHDLNRWWHRVRGKEDPYLKIGEINDRASKGDSEYVWALQDINFEVKQGEVLGIIGKNGAGKSTLLKILSKVTGPTTGSIKAKGRIASLLEVGTGFHQELTGRENIFLNGTILGMTKAEVSKKLDEIVDFAGVERFLDTPVKRYSSGMMVRLGFAVAAHLEPEILIVDEVLAVGDAEFQKKAVGKMQEVSSQGGRTVLFVSHNMGSINSLCTRALLLDRGLITYSGDTEKTISEYVSSSKNSNIDLSVSKNRQGAGNIRINKIIIGNPDEEVNVLAIGDKMAFHVDYQVKTKYPFSKPRLIIGVYSELNEGLTRFDSDANAIFDHLPLPIEGRISCIFEDTVNLMPGNYYANFALFNGGVIEDYVAQQIQFEVVDSNYLGFGKLFDDNRLAKVVYKHFWEVTS